MTLPPDLIARLKSAGVSTAWLIEQTGKSRAECVRILTSLGARRSSNVWQLPSLERTESRDRRMAGNHSGAMRDGDLPWARGE